MPGFLARMLITALGLWLAASLIPSMAFASATTLLIAALFLGAVNAIVRPIAVVLTLPITILTVGLFLLVINAAMLGLVASLLPGFLLGGFGAALGGSIIVSLTSWIASSFIGPRGRFEVLVVERRR
jgi:putative membrane protein